MKKPILKQVILCVLCAGLCAGFFAAAFAALPQCVMPLWLPCAAALSGGGLCAWLVFVPREDRRRKTFFRSGARALALACAAALVTLAAELFVFNDAAFLTRSLEPEEVDLSLVVDQHGNYPSMDGGPFALVPYENRELNITVSDLYTQVESLRVHMSGEAVLVEVEVFLEDEESAYLEQSVHTGYHSPGNTSYECVLHSSGIVYNMGIHFRIDAFNGQEVYVDSIEINPQIGVRWRPLRMGIVALGIWLALCMARFPWRRVAYCPGRGRHRAVLAACMLMTLLVYGALAAAAYPGQGTVGLVSPSAEAQGYSDPYMALFEAFQAGQLSVLAEPSEELLALANPYDPSERNEMGVDFLWDYALYNGRYYVYYGPAPLLLIYYPIFWLTGRLPTEALCAVLIGLATIPMMFYAVCGMARRYVRKPNLFLLALACMTACLSAAGPSLICGAGRYNNVLALTVCMMAATVGLGLHAVSHGTSSWRRAADFLLCGVCFGLQSMCRANTLLMTTAFLAPPFVGVLADRAGTVRGKARDALCFLIPAAAGVGLVMAYNWARFGSPAEFGQLYQLTVDDVHYNVFRPEYIPQALYGYLLQPPTALFRFPYLAAFNGIVNVTGTGMSNGGLLSVAVFPVAWLALFLSCGLREGIVRPALRREAGLSVRLSLFFGMVLMVVSFFYAGPVSRYIYDELIFFVFAGLLCGLCLCHTDGNETPLFPGRVFVLLCALTSLAGLLLGAGSIEGRNPALFAEWINTFFPY